MNRESMPPNPSSDHLIRRFCASLDGAETTADKYRAALTEFAVFLDRPILEARRAHVLDFMDHLKGDTRREWIKEQRRAGRLPGGARRAVSGKLSASTRKGHLSALRSFWKWAMLSERTDSDPTHGVPPPRVDTRRGLTLTAEQLRAFLNAKGTPRDRVQAYLLVYTAARMNELRMLRWSDVDFATELLHLRGKGGKDRTIPMHDTLVAELRRWRTTQTELAATNKQLAVALDHSDTAYVLLTRTGRPLSQTTMGKQAKWRAARAELMLHAPGTTVSVENTSKLHCHALRRSWATVSLNNGVPLDAVADALGHSSVDTCRRHYAFAGDERRRQTFEGLRL